MNTIKCNVTGKEFQVKKICKVADMPKNADRYWTCYNDNGVYDIFRTPAGILYSKPPRIY